MDYTSFLVISVSSNLKNGNVYKMIQNSKWKAKSVHYQYLDGNGNPIGRQKKVDLNNKKSIPEQLRKDIENDAVVKISYNASMTRIFLSAVLNYPPHEYIRCDSWLDVRVIARMNGYTTDSFSKLAETLNVRVRANKAAPRFNALVQIIAQLTKSHVMNISRLHEYAVNQTINDRGIRINMTALRSGIRLIGLFNYSVLLFKAGVDYTTDAKSIQQNLCNKYSVQTCDELYRLLENDETLTEIEKIQIRIMRFRNSNTVKKLISIAKNKCSDDRLRGVTFFWSNPITSKYGGTDIFTKDYKFSTVSPDDYIEAVSYIEDVNIDQVDDLIEKLKNLLALIFVTEEKKQVVDLSRGLDYIIAKMTGSEWRINAYNDDNLADTLRIKWKSVCLPDSTIVKNDRLLACGNYSVMLDTKQIKEWKHFNDDLFFVYGKLENNLINAYKKNKIYNYLDVVFECQPDRIILYLPTGRTVCIPYIFQNHNFYIKGSNQEISGKLLFKIICLALQRELVADTISTLYSCGIKVIYNTNDMVVIDHSKALPHTISEKTYIDIYSPIF